MGVRQSAAVPMDSKSVSRPFVMKFPLAENLQRQRV
jgi:hypothetical protein